MRSIILMLAVLTLSPHPCRPATEYPLDDAPDFPVVLHGTVDGVEPRGPSDERDEYCTWCTFLSIKVHEYIIGSGTPNVRLLLSWINTSQWAMEAEGITFSVPVLGDSAIFWIPSYSARAQLGSPGQIWALRNGSISELGWTLADAKAAIRDASLNLGLEKHIREADLVVRGRWVSTDIDSQRDPVAFTTIAVDSVLKGEYPGDSVIVSVAEKRAIVEVHETEGTYLLTSKDGARSFRFTDPRFTLVPEYDGHPIVGYRVVTDQPVDRLIPITAPIESLLAAANSTSQPDSDAP
jgi:hypothetical protein